MAKISWLHVSDSHFRANDNYDSEVIITSFLRELEKNVNENIFSPDFIAFTGDLAFSGKTEEYVYAVEKFLDPLLEISKVSMVIFFIVP